MPYVKSSEYAKVSYDNQRLKRQVELGNSIILKLFDALGAAKFSAILAPADPKPDGGSK